MTESSRASPAAKLAQLVGFPGEYHTEADKQSFIRHVMDMHKRDQKLPRNFIGLLVEGVEDQLGLLPNVVPISRDVCTEGGTFVSSVTVIGDLHGQYQDFSAIELS